jgi:predicted MFS family arabinose efflux permease
MSLISRTGAARGRAFGWNGMLASIGLAAAPLATQRLCEDFSWQGAYAVAGFAMCAVAIGCGFLPVDDSARAASPLVPPPARADGDRRVFFLLCCAAMLGGLSYRGNTLIQPAYFAERVHGLGFGAATSLVYLFGIAGQYAGGRLADRRDPRWLYLGFHAASLPALLMMASATGTPLIGAGALFVFFSLGMQPIENSLFARFTPARWRATAYGIKWVLTFGVGALAVRLVEHVSVGGNLAAVILCLAGIVALLVAVIAALVASSGGVAFRNQARAALGPDVLIDAPPAA